MPIGTVNALFGALLAATGLYLAGAGPAAAPLFGITAFPPPGGGPAGVAAEWRLVAFVRMFGIVLFLGGAMLWAVGRHLEPMRVRPFAITVSAASGLAFAMALIQQTALWNSVGGAVLVALLGLMSLAYGWTAVKAAPAEMDIVTTTYGDGA